MLNIDGWNPERESVILHIRNLGSVSYLNSVEHCLALFHRADWPWRWCRWCARRRSATGSRWRTCLMFSSWPTSTLQSSWRPRYGGRGGHTVFDVSVQNLRFTFTLLSCLERTISSGIFLQLSYFLYMLYINIQFLKNVLYSTGTYYQCFGSGSAFLMRIRIQQLIKLAPKAKKNSYHLELFD